MKSLTPSQEHWLYQQDRLAWAAYMAAKYAEKHSKRLATLVTDAIPADDRDKIREAYQHGIRSQAA